MTTARYRQLVEEIATQTEALEELDVEEQKSHSQTWQRRGHLIKLLQKAQGSIDSSIDRIVGGHAEDGS